MRSKAMSIDEAIEVLEDAVTDPSKGLPDGIFLYLTRVTPMVNVDLLVRDARGTLLAWRDDPYVGKGWHVPGGIIRLHERFEDRIRAVARSELGCEVEFEREPLAVNQLITLRKRTRSHFVSFLYGCRVPQGYRPRNSRRRPMPAGFLRWFRRCPEDLVKCQMIYKAFIDQD